MDVLKIVLLVAVLGYAALLLALFFGQSWLVFFPHRTLAATPADIGLAHEELHLACPDGAVHGWYVPADHARGTVLFCHGNGGNISHLLETLSIFHELDLNALVFDYPGYGQSTGKPTEQGCYASAAVCRDWLLEQRGEAAGRVVVMGRSLGGPVAAWLAASMSRMPGTGAAELPAGLILESTFTALPDVGARLYPLLPVRLLSRFRFDTRKSLARVRCPVLVAHSPEDDLVPYSLGRELLAAAGAQGRFLELAGDHNAGFLLSGDAYVAGLDQFFSSVLPAGPADPACAGVR